MLEQMLEGYEQRSSSIRCIIWRCSNRRHAQASVSEKLSGSLRTLVGVAGYRSLLSRALALGNTEVSWLKAVHVTVDGSLEGFDEAKAHVSNVEVAKGEAILIAHLLGQTSAYLHK